MEHRNHTHNTLNYQYFMDLTLYFICELQSVMLLLKSIEIMTMTMSMMTVVGVMTTTTMTMMTTTTVMMVMGTPREILIYGLWKRGRF